MKHYQPGPIVVMNVVAASFEIAAAAAVAVVVAVVVVAREVGNRGAEVVADVVVRIVVSAEPKNIKKYLWILRHINAIQVAKSNRSAHDKPVVAVAAEVVIVRAQD